MDFKYLSQNRTLITMSAGMSMAAWEQSGIIARELAYYKALSKYIGPLSFISYGDHPETEKRLLNQYIPDAEIAWMRPSIISRIPSGLFLSSFLPPLNIKRFQSIQCIRTNQMSGAWAGAKIAHQLKKPLIIRCGYLLSKNILLEKKVSSIKKNGLLYLEKWCVKRADAFIVTYSRAKQYLERKYHIPSEKFWIIGNPIDLNLFKPSDSPASMIRDLLFIGRFMPEKNISTILQACQKANATITLLGKGPFKKKMVALAESLSIDAHFIDYMPNEKIPNLMRNHRMFILASHFEGNPKVLLEAMACEMPCIASNIPEHRDLILHEKEGLIADATPEALCQAVQTIKKIPDLGKALGKQARKKIQQEYSLESNALKESRLHQILKTPA